MTVPTPLPEPSQSPNWAAQLNAAITDRYEDAKQTAAEAADTINTGRLSEDALEATFLPKADTGATGLAVLAAALPADAREALDITIDTSVGTRVLVGDVMVYGDTGWRAIATWDDAGTITGDIGTGLEPVEGRSGGVYWRRSGERVALRIVAARATANVQSFAIPAGFRPSGVPYPTGSIATETVAASYFQAGAGTVYLWVPSGTAIPRGDSPSYGAEVSWETARSWPTTLPGTPA